MLRSVLCKFKQDSSLLLSGRAFMKSMSSNAQQANFKWRYFSVLAGVSGLITGAFVYVKTNKMPQYVLADSTVENGNKNEKKWKLYQYMTCPFCCKVRTFLDYYGIDYEIVEVNPLMRKEVKFSEYKKVPFLKNDDYQLNDSSLIISVLKTQLLSNNDLSTILSFYPNIEETANKDRKKKKFEYLNKYNVMYETGLSDDGHEHIKEEVKWRKWVDDVFVHLLSPNIYRTMRESFQAMEYFSYVGNFSTFERNMAYYAGAVFMYVIGKRLKKRHHLRDDVREDLYAETHRWVRAVGKDRPFHGGEDPNLADLAMYGVISAIEGLDAFDDLVKNTNIGPWYARMKVKVQNKEGVEHLKIQKLSIPPKS